MKQSGHMPSADTVLIVTASLQLRSTLRQCLHAMQPQCRLLEAAGDDEAIGLLRATDVALLLLDLQLPSRVDAALLGRFRDEAPAAQLLLLGEAWELAGLGHEPAAGARIGKAQLLQAPARYLPRYLLPQRPAAALRGTYGATR